MNASNNKSNTATCVVRSSLKWGALIAVIYSPLVFSAVSAEKASEIGSKLTPAGAEKAGDTGLGIPKWDGELPRNAGTVDSKGFLADPFAGERPLFVITAATVDQYKGGSYNVCFVTPVSV